MNVSITITLKFMNPVYNQELHKHVVWSDGMFVVNCYRQILPIFAIVTSLILGQQQTNIHGSMIGLNAWIYYE